MIDTTVLTSLTTTENYINIGSTASIDATSEAKTLSAEHGKTYVLTAPTTALGIAVILPDTDLLSSGVASIITFLIKQHVADITFTTSGGGLFGGISAKNVLTVAAGTDKIGSILTLIGHNDCWYYNDLAIGSVT